MTSVITSRLCGINLVSMLWTYSYSYMPIVLELVDDVCAGIAPTVLFSSVC